MNSRLITLLALSFTLTISCKQASSTKTNGDQKGKRDFQTSPLPERGNPELGQPNDREPVEKEPVTSPGNGDGFVGQQYDACYTNMNGVLRILRSCPQIDNSQQMQQINICTRYDNFRRCVGITARCDVQVSQATRSQVYFCQESQANTNPNIGRPGLPNNNWPNQIPGQWQGNNPVNGNPNFGPGNPNFGTNFRTR